MLLNFGSSFLFHTFEAQIARIFTRQAQIYINNLNLILSWKSSFASFYFELIRMHIQYLFSMCLCMRVFEYVT